MPERPASGQSGSEMKKMPMPEPVQYQNAGSIGFDAGILCENIFF
jgi:hypothetical protein